MLGQPIPMLIPEVIGFKLTGAMPEGATATDLVLTVTQMLRKKGVVGKFVEFYGPGLAEPDPRRPGDHRQHGPGIWRHLRLLPGHASATIDYLTATGRDAGARRAGGGLRQGAGPVARARRARSGVHRHAGAGHGRRSLPSLAGPKRPQDRVLLTDAAAEFKAALAGDFGKADDMRDRVQGRGRELRRRPRRRGDRRHHLLHQHLQPQRADRRRPGGQEGRREGPEGEALGEDLAGPRLAGGHRLSDRRPA